MASLAKGRKMYTNHYSYKATAPTQPVPNTDQVQNNAGGYVWPVDDWCRLDRFLLLGTEGGSYYATERELTVENAQTVSKLLNSDTDGVRAVKRIVEISTSGRAAKNDPALFALAIASASKHEHVRSRALGSLQDVARTGTHLFQYLNYVKHFRGWGRGLRNAVINWYSAPGVEYQILKYRNRHGWSHRDAMLMAHVGKPSARLILNDGSINPDYSELSAAYCELQAATTVEQAMSVLASNVRGITWEMVPTALLGEPKLWSALIEFDRLPLTALIRNIGRMTANGAIKPFASENKHVIEKLRNADYIHKSRVHPASVVAAYATYRSGCGQRSSLSWHPVPQIVDGLDDCFRLSWHNVTPTGKNIVLAVDVSGSMSGYYGSKVFGYMNPAQAAAAMSIITLATEPNSHVIGFDGDLHKMPFTAKSTLRDAMNFSTGGGWTNASLPMAWAIGTKLDVDAFVLYTDNENWCGDKHPVQALNAYRNRFNGGAKLVSVGMVANNWSVADKNDARQMDVVGFDTAAPALISDFIGQ